MNKTTVLLILVDGMRHDYINPVDSPFLDALRKQNIDAIVRETFSFELHPAFFAGLWPEDCGMANMFCYNPVDSPFRSIDTSHGDRSRISQDLRVEAARRGYSMIKHIGGCAEIPFHLLKYFDFSAKYHPADFAPMIGHKTLFEYLRNDAKKWLWIAYPDGPGTTDGVLNQFCAKITGDEDFIYLHFSELDWVGHEFGPHSMEQKRTLMEIDEAIRKVFCKLTQSFSGVRSVIFGDHGQVEINKNIDIESKLEKTGLILEKDYLYFLDSTQARFWFFNDAAKKKVIDVLSSIPEGRILTKADYERLHFRFKHNKFGELIFVVNGGIGISPNFFQRGKPYKGLHGYLPEVEGNWAKLIITGCGINKHFKHPVEMVDIYPSLLELLGYEKPANIQAKSVFRGSILRMGQSKYEASIVMPTYNRVGILKRNILAVENQSYRKENLELIVVDDGSTDGTESFLSKYERDTRLNFKYLRQVNSGPAAARNLGIRNALGHIIILVGDDTIMSSDFIENHLKFHQEWTQLSHACLGFIDWSKNIKVNPLMELITSKEGGQQFIYDFVEKQDPENIGYTVFWSSNVSFKRLFCLTHGLFNDKVFKKAMWEDIELGYRLEKAGLVLHYRKDCKVYHEHEVNFEGFVERQRMVGWYSHDLSNFGIPVGYSVGGYEMDMLYSKDALKDIIKAVKKFERDCKKSDIPMLRRIYNSAIYYAALVGYKERENKLKKGVNGIIVLLHNLLLAHEQIREKEGHMGNLEASIKEKNVHIANLETIVRDKDAYIYQLEVVAKAREAEIEGIRASLAEKEHEIGSLQEAINQKSTQISDIEDVLSEKESQIGNLQDAINQKASQVSHLEGMVNEKDGEIGNLKETINQKATQISHLESVNWEKEAALNHIYNSHGWKALLIYYKLRNKFLPINTKRRLLLKVTFRTILGPGKVFKNLNKANLKKFFYYFRVVEPSVLEEKIERKISVASKISEAHRIEAEFDENIALEKIENPDFPHYEQPLVSIIILAWNNWIYTYNCLKSLSKNTNDVPYNVIVVDNGSTDETSEMLKKVKNIKMIRFDINIGVMRACNKAAEQAESKYILFLNNDTQVTKEWLKSMVDIAERDEKVGAVGGKLIYPDGKLQEAGGILWNDPVNIAWNFGRYDDPNKWEYNYVKEVDYCSGACLLVRNDLFKKIGLFDTRYTPAYCDDSDLALSIRKLGYKVVYQPKAEIFHFEGLTCGTDTSQGQKQFQIVNQKKFFEKWQHVLESSHFENGKNVFLARDRSQKKRLLLFVDHYVPTWDKDAGSLTMYMYLKLLLERDFKIVFVPDNFYKMEPYTSVLQQIGIEVLYGDLDFKKWVRENGKYFHYVWLNRPHISTKYIDDILCFTKAKVVYYTHDLHYLRETRRYELEKSNEILKEIERVKEMEFYLFENVDVILTPSDKEVEIIKGNFPSKEIISIPACFYSNNEFLSRENILNSFHQRKDLIYLGGFQHPPNADAVRYFIEEIFHIIKNKLPNIKFHIIGSDAPESIKKYSNEQIIVAGYVEDLAAYFRNCRVFVAPLRYGAGVKVKIISSMFYGVPVVTTSIGNEGINLTDGQNCMIADNSEEFASKVIELYTNEKLWKKLALNSIDFVEKHFSKCRAEECVDKIFTEIEE